MIIQIIQELLKEQDKCPSCGINWRAVEDMLHDGLGSDNYQAALVITANCDICRVRFRDELERLDKGTG